MEALTKIIYAIIVGVVVWFVLCGVIVITTDDTAGIHDVADASVSIIDHVADAIREMIPVIPRQSATP